MLTMGLWKYWGIQVQIDVRAYPSPNFFTSGIDSKLLTSPDPPASLSVIFSLDPSKMNLNFGTWAESAIQQFEPT